MAHITISDTEPRDQYTATAGQTEFTVSFPFFTDASLTVYQTLSGADFDETADLLTLTTNYTVTGAGNVAGVTKKITLVSAASAGDIITILGSEPFSRSSDYQDNGDFLAETINDEQDKVIMLLQQLREEIDRALKVSTLTSNITTVLPTPQALGLLRWDANANAVENIQTSDLSSDLISTQEWIVDRYVDGVDFTAGSTTTLTTSDSPGDIRNTIVALDGLILEQDDYSLSGTTITFDSAIPGGTSIVEIRYTKVLTETAIDDVFDGPAVSGYVSGIVTYLNEDGSGPGLNLTSIVTENTWESIGPTGSGATNIFPSMDAMPSGTRIATFKVLGGITSNTSGTVVLTGFARMNGSSAAANDATTIFDISASNIDSGDNSDSMVFAHVPLDSDGVFEFNWTENGSSSRSIIIRLAGFIYS